MKTCFPLFFLIAILFPQALTAQTDCEPSIQSISDAFHSVFFLDTLNGLIASRSYLLRTDDGGHNWKQIEGVSVRFGADFHFLDSQNGFLFNRNRTVYKTTDAGNSWDRLNTTGISEAINDICFLNRDTGYIATESNRLLRTADGGQSWQDTTIQMGFDGILDVHFVSDSVGYVLGESGQLVRINLHQPWDTLQVPLSQWYQASEMWFVNRDSGWVEAVRSNNQNELYRTTDGGQNWTMIPNVPNMLSWQAFGLDTIYTLSNSLNKVLKTTDGGQNWTQSSQPYIFSDLGGLHFLNQEWGMIVGGEFGSDGGRMIAKTGDGGQNWEMLCDLDDKNIYDIDFPSDSIGYLINESREIYKSSDGGQSWSLVYRHDQNPPTTSSDEGRVIQFFDEQRGVAFSRQLMIKTQDGGDSWTASYAPFSLLGNEGIKFYSDSLWFRFNPSIHDSLLITHDAGLSWDRVPNGFDLFDLYPFNADTLIVPQYHRIYRSTDGGHTWSLQFSDPNQNMFLTQIEFANDSVGYASGNDGAFLKSVDGGLSWTIMNSPTLINLNALKFYEEDFGYAASLGTSTAFQITDGGQTWKQINTLLDLVSIDIYSPGRTYIAGEDGGIAIATSHQAPPKPSLIVGPQQVCLRSETYAVMSDPFFPTFYWEVSGGGTLTSNANEATVDWTSPGQYVLSVWQLDSCDTSMVQQLVVEVLDIFTPTITILNDSTLITDAPDYIQWFLDGIAIPGATSDTLFFSGNGSYSVRNTNACGEGFSASVTSLESEIAFRIRLFPNPAHSFLNIEISTSSPEGEWTLLNQVGQVVLSGILSGEPESRIDLHGLAEGIYFFNIRSGSQSLSKKLLIR